MSRHPIQTTQTQVEPPASERERDHTDNKTAGAPASTGPTDPCPALAIFCWEPWW